MTTNFIGIDVSKDTLDVFSTETSRHCKISNGNKAIRKLFSTFDVNNTFVVLENTGGYEKRCLNMLLRLGFRVHRTNNNLAKDFIKSLGKRGKTDKVDAIALATYGKERHEQLELYKPRTATQENIRQLALYLTALKLFRVQEKNRLKSPGCEDISSEVEKTLEVITDRISEVEKVINTIINSDKNYKEKVDLLCSYKGIGKSTAVQLISHLPELGTIQRRPIAALSGVAPFSNDSGKYIGYRSTKGGGRPVVKRTLFLAALSAIRFNDKIAEHYIKKQSEGKKKMVAITACMRKMVIHLNAIMRDGEIRYSN